jgi:2-polyprenyl-3-methyl-5-hydroxy-6-metoxy-1,4-benzoquinol methylase
MEHPQTKAAAANYLSYEGLSREEYIHGAPHIRHQHLRRLFDKLATDVFDEAKKHCAVPRVLDLGAGEGSVTDTYLRRGAKVTAIDVSEGRLKQLRKRCEKLGGELESIQAEVSTAVAALRDQAREFDVVVATAFLHHVPNYGDLLRDAIKLLVRHGQLLTFEDPLRYDSLGWSARIFGGAAYLSWRLFQGDVTGGARRYARRKFGNYDNTCEDDVEYHVVRNGVDQDELKQLLSTLGMKCDIVRYFSTQAPSWEALGRRLGVANTFGIVGVKI